jgi:diacylglycerol kinase family enzyme
VSDAPVPRALVVNPGAGAVTANVMDRLRTALSDHALIEFDPALDLRSRLAPDARVVVAGGDGTVGHVARAIAGTEVALGVIGLGTFNNFARALGVPEDLEAAIEVARGGAPRPVTVGRVNGRIFLEAAAVGIFGEAIELGQSLKDLRFGELGDHLRRLISARPFQYRLTGDLELEGTALSLVFANTPSTGAELTIGEGSVADPYLELSTHVGETR